MAVNTTIMMLIGWLGMVFTSLCVLLQLRTTIKTRTFDGLSIGFIGIWLIGESCTLIYTTSRLLMIPLIITNCINIISCAIILILYLKWKKGKKMEDLSKEKEKTKDEKEKRQEPKRRYFTLEDNKVKYLIENHSNIETF